MFLSKKMLSFLPMVFFNCAGAAIARDACISFDGTLQMAFEQRKSINGQPGELVGKPKVITQKVRDDNQQWCVNDVGITYIEKGKPPVIKINYPFDQGFVDTEIKSSGLPVAITGIAKKTDNVISVNWLYTIGTKLTQARLSATSMRVEVSFAFELTGDTCKLNSYKFTYLNNSGNNTGVYTGKKTISSDATCRLI